MLIVTSCDPDIHYFLHNNSFEQVYFVEHYLSDRRNYYDDYLEVYQVPPHKETMAGRDLTSKLLYKGEVLKVYVVDAKVEDVPDHLTFDQLQSCYWHRVIGTITVTDKQNDILFDYGLSYPANEYFPVEYNDAYGQEQYRVGMGCLKSR